MKVCFIVGTLARGGAEKQLMFMLRALENAGVTAKILCLTRGEFYEQESRKLGVEVEYVGAARSKLGRLGRIIKILFHERPQIIQSSHFYTNIYAALAGKFLSVPAIGAVRSDLGYEMSSHPLTGRWQIGLPDLLIVNSRLGYERLIENGVPAEKIEFVKNMCPVDTVKTSTRTIDKESLKILFAGRLDENKRPDVFVRLAARLVNEVPAEPLEFEIAGDGVLRGEMENLAARLGLLPGKMRFLGACEKMSELYDSADILVSTSVREGTPNVVLEAMAHALAVVATDSGGTREILNENNGILVDVNDEEKLFRAVRGLIENSDSRRRLGSNGQRYVLENHSLAVLESHLLKIYDRLTGAPKPAAAFPVKTEEVR